MYIFGVQSGGTFQKHHGSMSGYLSGYSLCQISIFIHKPSKTHIRNLHLIQTKVCFSNGPDFPVSCVGSLGEHAS